EIEGGDAPLAGIRRLVVMRDRNAGAEEELRLRIDAGGRRIAEAAKGRAVEKTLRAGADGVFQREEGADRVELRLVPENLVIGGDVEIGHGREADHGHGRRKIGLLDLGARTAKL